MDPVQVLSAFGSLALIIGIGVGMLQLRIVNKQRQEERVLRLYAPFLDPVFNRAFWWVQTLEYESFEEFDATATLDDLTSLDVLGTFFEMMGLLWKRGFATLEEMDDILASPVLVTWYKAAPLVYGYRRKLNSPDWGEWWELLAIALDARMTALGEPHQGLPPAQAA
jgi:hypothetical protein